MITKEAQGILLLTLFLLKKKGELQPSKRKVLDFIKINQLQTFYVDDCELLGHEEKRGEKEVASAKQRLVDENLIEYSKWNSWQISQEGEQRVIIAGRKIYQKFNNMPDKVVEYLENKTRINQNTVKEFLKIGKENDPNS